MTREIEILNGWKLNEEEVSNCVYKFEFIDCDGRIVGCTDHNYERGIETCVNYAFDVEKQIKSRSWNKFLFDVFNYRLKGKKLDEKIYHDDVFGDWQIRQKNKQVILDGKDLIIEFQKKSILGYWKTKELIYMKDIQYEDVKKICDEFK